MPSPFAEQFPELVSKLLELTVNVIGEVAEQLQDIGAVLPDPLKEKVALAGQFCWGTLTVTWITCPGFNVPLDGLKLMPLIPVLVALQLRLP